MHRLMETIVLAAATIGAATDGDLFRAIVADVLVPALRPGMVVVMDNLAAHKVAGIRQSIESAACRLVYLPPYSPDFSPIEHIWSKIKQSLRTAAPREIPSLHQAIEQALIDVTGDDCHHCYENCGYRLHLT